MAWKCKETWKITFIEKINNEIIHISGNLAESFHLNVVFHWWFFLTSQCVFYMEMISLAKKGDARYTQWYTVVFEILHQKCDEHSIIVYPWLAEMGYQCANKWLKLCHKIIRDFFPYRPVELTVPILNSWIYLPTFAKHLKHLGNYLYYFYVYPEIQ